jgi:hypothetical protein
MALVKKNTDHSKSSKWHSFSSRYASFESTKSKGQYYLSIHAVTSQRTGGKSEDSSHSRQVWHSARTGKILETRANKLRALNT